MYRSRRVKEGSKEPTLDRGTLRELSTVRDRRGISRRESGYLSKVDDLLRTYKSSPLNF